MPKEVSRELVDWKVYVPASLLFLSCSSSGANKRSSVNPQSRHTRTSRHAYIGAALR